MKEGIKELVPQTLGTLQGMTMFQFLKYNLFPSTRLMFHPEVMCALVVCLGSLRRSAILVIGSNYTIRSDNTISTIIIIRKRFKITSQVRCGNEVNLDSKAWLSLILSNGSSKNFYLCIWGTDRDRELPFIGSFSRCPEWSWAGLGTKNSIQDSHMGSKTPITIGIISAFQVLH